jgi:colanic acid biosynthesis glycosyl transferase WcaI
MSKLADEFVAKGHEVTVLTSVPHYDTNRVWPEYSHRLVYLERAGAMQVYRMYTHVARDKANVAHRLLAYGSFNLLSVVRGATLPRHDVILVPSPPLSNGVIADLLGRLRGIPYVYNVQDIWPDVAVRAGVLKNEKMIRRLKGMEQYVYRRAAGIVVISEGFRKNLLAKGVPARKISVIPNFIDIDFVTPQPKKNVFSAKHGIEEKFVVLFAGNMGFSQGLETVLDAANLLKGYSRIEFLMVGNGSGKNDSEAYLEKLGLMNVRFLPFQPQEELPAMYGAADVCLIPLRRGFTTESVPCKLFTIMAAGRAAIAAVDHGSDTWNLLQRSQSGLCVEPEAPDALADAILHYYDDEAARLEAGRSGRRYAEAEFHPATLSEAYLEALRRAVRAEPDPGDLAKGDRSDPNQESPPKLEYGKR